MHIDLLKRNGMNNIKYFRESNSRHQKVQEFKTHYSEMRGEYILQQLNYFL